MRGTWTTSVLRARDWRGKMKRMLIRVVKKGIAAAAEKRRYRRGGHERDMDELLENSGLERKNEDSGVDADLRDEERCCCCC